MTNTFVAHSFWATGGKVLDFDKRWKSLNRFFKKKWKIKKKVRSVFFSILCSLNIGKMTGGHVQTPERWTTSLIIWRDVSQKIYPSLVFSSLSSFFFICQMSVRITIFNWIHLRGSIQLTCFVQRWCMLTSRLPQTRHIKRKWSATEPNVIGFRILCVRKQCHVCTPPCLNKHSFSLTSFYVYPLIDYRMLLNYHMLLIQKNWNPIWKIFLSQSFIVLHSSSDWIYLIYL